MTRSKGAVLLASLVALVALAAVAAGSAQPLRSRS